MKNPFSRKVSIYIILGIIIALCFSWFTWKDYSLKTDIEAIASQALGTPVGISEFQWAGISNTAQVRGVTIFSNDGGKVIFIKNMRLSLEPPTDDLLVIKSILISGVSIFSYDTKSGHSIPNLQTSLTLNTSREPLSPLVIVQDIRIGELSLTRDLADTQTLETLPLNDISIEGDQTQYSPDNLIRLLTTQLLSEARRGLFKAQMSDGYNATRKGLDKIGRDLTNIGKSISDNSLKIGQKLNKDVKELGTQLQKGLNALTPKKTENP